MTESAAASNATTREDRYRLAERTYRTTSKKVLEIDVPALTVLAIDGNEPPASPQYRAAISTLYSVGYTLKMGLKFAKVPRPEGYFDYAVAPLHTLWVNTTGDVRIDDPATLKWTAFLAVPDFISPELVNEAKLQTHKRHPEIETSALKHSRIEEGRCVQALHIGPYDQEQRTIEKLLAYIEDHSLQANGPHHEIYISDPGRTAADKLKTLIRYPVKPR